MALWNEGFPLQLVSQCIEPDNLTYSCPESCKLHFEGMTKLAWDNLDDADGVPIECPRCQNRTVVPWSTRRRKGLAEDLLQVCQSCKYVLGNHVLVVRKLRQDLYLLLRRDLPLPGTCWSVEEKHGTLTPKKAPNDFVKRYLMSMLLEETRPTNLFPDISQTIESLGRTVVKPALPMIHDIFEHYQYVENSSCNLRAAVTRVLESASAMQDTDLSETDFDSPHTVTQYIAFLRGQCKGFLSWGPDLSEIDLTDPTMWVWSTHLLTPRSYSEFFRGVGNGLPVDWQPPHSPKCSLCLTMRPPSFARRFFQGLVSLSAWKEFMEAAA
ncbi:similar to An04g03160 [Aspergillus luchuensis IFO 4308]|nr:similar to An04g03160 [Aspergillus luchuensis IFO 4308]